MKTNEQKSVIVF